jgi:hypothetical protein
MTYQLSQLVTDVKVRAKDTSLSDDLVKTFLQATQDEVLNRSRFPFMEASTTATLSIAATTYTLPSDVDVVISLLLRDTSTNVWHQPRILLYEEFQERFPLVSTYPQGAPPYAAFYAGQLLWSCPLDKAYELQTKYVKVSSRLTADADVPLIPERYKEILMLGALAGVEEYRENFDLAGVYRRRIEELAEDMLGRTVLRQVMTPHKSRFDRVTSNDPWGA